MQNMENTENFAPKRESETLRNERKALLETVYTKLFTAFGSQHWWEADTPFEMEVGAILTQNTTWTAVEKSIRNLKGHVSPEGILALPQEALEEAIRPSGYFRQKANYLKHLAAFCKENGTAKEDFKKLPTEELRQLWLSQKGVGKETADSILLYAMDRPVFIIDAYTRRVLSRVLDDDSYLKQAYDAVAKVFTEVLPKDTAYYGEYHGLLVRLCKDICLKKNPNCKACPLSDLCKAVDKTVKKS